VEATASYTNLNRLNAPNLLGEGQFSSGLGYVTDYNLPMDYKPLEKNLAVNKDGSQNQTVINSSPSQDNASIPWYWWNTLRNNTTFTHNQLLGSVKLTAELLSWLSVMAMRGWTISPTSLKTTTRPPMPPAYTVLIPTTLPP